MALKRSDYSALCEESGTPKSNRWFVLPIRGDPISDVCSLEFSVRCYQLGAPIAVARDG
jgi:hypothetical protein